MTEHTLSFSPFIIGTMRFGIWGADFSIDALESTIDACVDLGLIDFDHADIYGMYTDEEKFGNVLRRRPDLRNKTRHTTKCGIKLVTENRPSHSIKSYDSTQRHIIQSAENSLKNLSVESLDVLLIHRPDYLMDPHDIAEAFEKLKKQGKVKYFGVSNFTKSQFELLNSFTPLVTNQLEISILQRAAFDDGTLDQCLMHNIIPTAWSPFGGGNIFGQTQEEHVSRIQNASTALQEKYNIELDQLLLAWLLKHPAGIIPVLGTSKIDRIKLALEAQKVDLSHEDWYVLWSAATGNEVA